MKARALKEVWNIAAVIPVEKGGVGGGGGHQKHQHQHHHSQSKQQKEIDSNGSSFSDDLVADEDNFLGLCSQELLARGSELLKRTRKGVRSYSPLSLVQRILQLQRKRANESEN